MNQSREIAQKTHIWAILPNFGLHHFSTYIAGYLDAKNLKNLTVRSMRTFSDCRGSSADYKKNRKSGSFV